MKRFILTIITLECIINSYCQTPEENTIYSVYVFDSVGNLYQTKKTYDHKPTRADSLEFDKIYRLEIGRMMQENELVNQSISAPQLDLKLKPRKKKLIKRKYTSSKNN